MQCSLIADLKKVADPFLMLCLVLSCIYYMDSCCLVPEWVGCFTFHVFVCCCDYGLFMFDFWFVAFHYFIEKTLDIMFFNNNDIFISYNNTIKVFTLSSNKPSDVFILCGVTLRNKTCEVLWSLPLKAFPCKLQFAVLLVILNWRSIIVIWL